jgi:hypothetical protein
VIGWLDGQVDGGVWICEKMLEGLLPRDMDGEGSGR